jgi:ABC-type uncharacterized transport system permease subunit
VIDAFLHAALTMTTPILLAATGGLVNRIGGLVNLGLESMMLAGALVAVIVSAKTGSSALATFAALTVGAVVGLAMSLVVTRLSANEVIVGLGFTVATAGLVRFLLKSIYGSRARTIRRASRCCRASTSLSSIRFQCLARSFRVRTR